LFFGTTDQLHTALEAELATCTYLILDLRRVQSVDVTAAHLLDRIEDTLSTRGATLIWSALPRNLPSGRDIERYFNEVGLVRPGRRARRFDELDEALEWVENRILDAAGVARAAESLLELHEIELLKGRKEETIAALESCLQERSVRAGERLFARGDLGDELFLIRRGAVRVMLPLDGARTHHHLATFGRGDFFGEMAFLDRGRRSADAYALTDSDLFVLSRERFDAFAPSHKKAAISLLHGLAHTLAVRLRYADAELQMLRQS
jgi:SulP family sulfate permease